MTTKSNRLRSIFKALTLWPKVSALFPVSKRIRFPAYSVKAAKPQSFPARKVYRKRPLRLSPREPARRGVLCESVLPVAPERVNVDPFHRAPVSLVVLVHPASSTRLTQIGPVGRLVTGAAKLRIYERLQKQRAIAVKAFPVRRQLACAQREDRACQITHPHPGQDQKPRVVYNELKLARPLLIGPADPTISPPSSKRD